MKRVETRRTVALLLAAYILGMTLGSAIIWAIPFFKNKEHILTIAADASGCWRTGCPSGALRRCWRKRSRACRRRA